MSAFVGQKLLALAYFMIVAHLAGVAGTGKYLIAVSFASIFAVMMDLGLGNVLVREVAKENDDAQVFLTNTLGVKLALSGFFLIIVQLAAWGMGYSLEVRLMIAVASVAMVLEAVQVTMYSVIRGFQNLRPEAIGVILGQLLVLAVGTALFFAWRSPLALVTALALNTAWNVLWGGFTLKYRYGLKLWPRLQRATVRRLALLAAPFALAAVFSRVYSYVDQVMLSRYVTPAESGLYGVAYKLTFAFSFLPSSFAAALYPAMSEYWHKDRAHLSEVYANALKYLLVVATPITVGLAVLAVPVMPFIFGHEFAPASAPLRVLVFSLLFSFLYWPIGSLLNACDRQTHNTTVMGLAMATSIGINLWLLPHHGVMGAATANLVSNVVLFGTAAVFAARVVRLPLAKVLRGATATLLAGSFMGFSAYLLFPLIGFLPTVAAAVVVYPLMLVILGAVTLAEARGLVDLFLHRRRQSLDLPTV
jgi:O-antigen/teichoic acid export membrane protein